MQFLNPNQCHPADFPIGQSSQSDSAKDRRQHKSVDIWQSAKTPATYKNASVFPMNVQYRYKVVPKRTVDGTERALFEPVNTKISQPRRNTSVWRRMTTQYNTLYALK